MIEILLLDLDDTILDFAATERKSMTRFLLAHDIEPTEEILQRYHQINLELWLALERGELNRDEVGSRRFELLFGELGIQADPLACENMYRQFLAEGDDVLPGAVEAVKKLAEKFSMHNLIKSEALY